MSDRPSGEPPAGEIREVPFRDLYRDRRYQAPGGLDDEVVRHYMKWFEQLPPVDAYELDAPEAYVPRRYRLFLADGERGVAPAASVGGGWPLFIATYERGSQH